MKKKRTIKSKDSTNKRLKIFTWSAIAILALMGFIGLGYYVGYVDGSKYTGNISSGSSDVHHLAVSTRSSDAPMSVTVTAFAFGH